MPSAREKHPDISRATDDLIQRMMAKDPADRPQTPAELLQEIRDALAGKVHLRTKPVGSRQTAVGRQEPAGGHPHVVGGVSPRRETSSSSKTTWIVLAAVAVIAAIVAVVVLRRGPKPPDTATTPPTSVPQPPTPNTPHPTPIVVDDAEAKRKAAELAEKERVAKAKEDALTKARQQGEELLKQADAAIAAKDFAKARAALKSAQALGLPDLAAEAKKKLDEIASREKSSDEWAKWDAVKASAAKLVAAGKLDDAAKLLDGAKALPLDDIADLVAEQLKSIESTKSTMRKAALAAYQAESDKVWSLFKQRKYPEAEKLLAALSAKPEFGVRPSGAENVRVGDADSLSPAGHLKADLEAAKLLKEFWSAVERGVMARKGKFVSIAGKGGNVESVANGQVTLKVGTKELTAPLLGMDASQAAALAALKDDERGNLTRAIFLLAEGEKLDDAERLLAAAGTLPALPIYKDRLDRLLGRAKVIAEAKDADAREAAAREAWRQIQAASKGDLTPAQAKRVLTMLDVFDGKHGTTRVHAANREEAGDIRARVAADAASTRLTQKLNDIRQWEVEKGDWSVDPKSGGIMGKGDSRAFFKGDLPQEVRLDVSVNVRDGMRPRIRFEGAGFHFGNEGFERNLFVYGDGVRWQGGTPAPYVNGREYEVSITFKGGTVGVTVDGKAVATGTRASENQVKLGLEGGDGWSKGTTVFSRFRATCLGKEAAEHPDASQWQSLFDGKTLKGWQHVKLAQANSGKAYVEDGRIVLDMVPAQGNVLAWQGDFPTTNYELELQVARVAGEQLGSVVFPIGRSRCCLNLGDWGRNAGLDLVDGIRGWENLTATPLTIQHGRQYTCRLRVTEARIVVWLDDRRIIDLPTADHKFSVHELFAGTKSLALSTWNTGSAFSSTRFRRIEPGAAEAPKAGEWQSLFDGKTLGGWKPIKEVPQAPEVTRGDRKAGRVYVENGLITMEPGSPCSGIVWTREFPTTDYEFSMEAMRVAHNMSFGDLIFPIGRSRCRLLLGGAVEGNAVQLDLLDGRLGDGNPTQKRMIFERGRWYRVRLRVTASKVQVWLDDEQIIDQERAGHVFAALGVYEQFKPFGIAAWETTAAVRDVKVRRVGGE